MVYLIRETWLVAYYKEADFLQARSSGGERYPDTVEVVGSNPIVPTKKSRVYRHQGS